MYSKQYYKLQLLKIHKSDCHEVFNSIIMRGNFIQGTSVVSTALVNIFFTLSRIATSYPNKKRYLFESLRNGATSMFLIFYYIPPVRGLVLGVYCCRMPTSRVNLLA